MNRLINCQKKALHFIPLSLLHVVKSIQLVIQFDSQELIFFFTTFKRKNERKKYYDTRLTASQVMQPGNFLHNTALFWRLWPRFIVQDRMLLYHMVLDHKLSGVML